MFIAETTFPMAISSLSVKFASRPTLTMHGDSVHFLHDEESLRTPLQLMNNQVTKVRSIASALIVGKYAALNS